MKLVRLTKKNTTNNPLLALLWLDEKNEVYTLWREGWDMAQNIDGRIAHGLAQRWPRLQGVECVATETPLAAA